MSSSPFGHGGPPATVSWSLAQRECSGYSRVWDIGKSDTLVLFNPCQVKSINARISFFDDIAGKPKVCDYGFSNVSDTDAAKMADWLVKRLNFVCGGYQGMLRLQWSQVRDFFRYAAHDGDACAVWVVDDAPWRPAKIKPASRHSDGIEISHIKVGATAYVRTATGFEPVKCSR